MQSWSYPMPLSLCFNIRRGWNSSSIQVYDAIVRWWHTSDCNNLKKNSLNLREPSFWYCNEIQICPQIWRYQTGSFQKKIPERRPHQALFVAERQRWCFAIFIANEDELVNLERWWNNLAPHLKFTSEMNTDGIPFYDTFCKIKDDKITTRL